MCMANANSIAIYVHLMGTDTENTLPDGAIDVHVHTAPDLIDRYESDLQLAREADCAGMDAVVVKSHVVPTAGRVDLVNEAVGTDILYGGIALNGSVGGLNRDAVETALGLGGKIVWLPTAWSRNHASTARAAGEDRFVGQRIPDTSEEISVVRDGSVTPPTREIIRLAKQHDATIGTGHISPRAADVIVDACAAAGVTCLVNHACFRIVDIPIDQQVAMAEKGAIMEYCAYSVQSTPDHSVARVAEAINRIGPDNCLLATDFGQASNPPVEGLTSFVESVNEAGVDRAAVNKTVTDTPARVLHID